MILPRRSAGGGTVKGVALGLVMLATSIKWRIAIWLVGCKCLPHQRLVIFQVKALMRHKLSIN